MKILINAIALDGANISPLLIRLRNWQSRGAQIAFFGNEFLKENIISFGSLGSYDFINLKIWFPRQKDIRNIRSKFQFMGECLKRNIAGIFYLGKLKNKYDAVYSISAVLDTVIFPYLLKKADKKIKWAVVFDNTVPSRNFIAWIFFRASLRMMRSADCVFTVDQELKEYLVKNKIQRQKICARGNGLESDLINKAIVKDEYNFDALYVGRINEAKGIYDMLCVLKIVRKSFPDFRLAIMGDGDKATKTRFQKRSKKMKLEKNIQFLGYITGMEKFDIIKSSKCFWFLSYGESFGIALLEAVCCGLPAFAYDLPQLKRIYKNDEVIFSPKGDYEEVAQKVIELFKTGDFSNEKGKLLVDKYSWDKIAEIEYNSMVES